MSQDDFYQNVESEAWFKRNHLTYDASKAREGFLLRKNKQSIYNLLLGKLELKDLSTLEIGCSVGDLLFVLREKHKCHIKGIEPSGSAVQTARDVFGLEVEESTFLKSSLFTLNSSSMASFNLIILDDVIGWMDPKVLLSSLGALDWLLAENGHIFVRELYSPHAIRVKNHHYPKEQVFTYRYPGGVTKSFVDSGCYRSVVENLYEDRGLQKVQSSQTNALWKDSMLQKSAITVPTASL